MLSDDVEIVDRAIDHLCRGQDTVDAWLRIKAALAESTNSSHNRPIMPCANCSNKHSYRCNTCKFYDSLSDNYVPRTA